MRSNWNFAEPAVSVYGLAETVRRTMAQGTRDADDGQVRRCCEEAVLRCREAPLLCAQTKLRLARLVFCALRCELEILQDLADDPAVTEIMVNGPDRIFIERDGETFRADLSFETAERLNQVIQRLAARVGREMNELHPIVDARLSDGSRVNAVHAGIAIDGPVLTIRKFNRSRMTMEDLVRQGDVCRDASVLLQKLTAAGYNIFVSGGTSSGKTTFLNVLSDFIPGRERVVVIEDSAELQIRGIPNLVRMEARNANAQGKGAVPIRQLIRASLRQRPDRIIVGEVRGEEVVDMLAAMSTGHDGSLSTGHANSVRGMIGRLETLHISSSGFPAESVRAQIAEAIDVFVHLARTPDGHRRVVEICECAGLKDGEILLNPLYCYDPETGLTATGSRLQKTSKLRLHGLGEEG
ncbi:MAG: CpaF family protein [Firmicutes bacterium]|nr:CpaF family protein [Bacillota bacterium]